MAESVIRLSSGIKKFAILNENDVLVAELKINVQDTHLMEKFVALLESADSIAKDMNASVDKYESKKTKSIKDSKEIIKKSTDAIKKLIEDTEMVFGDGLFKEIFAECYELDEEFVPSIDSVVEFYDQITPIMKTIFEEKSNKYGVNKTGKKKSSNV